MGSCLSTPPTSKINLQPVNPLDRIVNNIMSINPNLSNYKFGTTNDSYQNYTFEDYFHDYEMCKKSIIHKIRIV